MGKFGITVESLSIHNHHLHFRKHHMQVKESIVYYLPESTHAKCIKTVEVKDTHIPQSVQSAAKL